MKKNNLFDWIIYISIALVISILPIVYIRQQLEKGTLKLEIEFFNTQDFMLYLWFTIFLIILIPIILITIKSMRINDLKWENEKLNNYIKEKEKEFESKMIYFEEEKKIIIGMEKSKIDELEKNYQNEIIKYKQEIKRLTSENEKLKRMKIMPQQKQQKNNIGNEKTIDYLKDIETKFSDLKNIINLQNDLQILKNKDELLEIIKQRIVGKLNSIYIYYPLKNFDFLNEIFNINNLIELELNIVFTNYYEEQIIEFVKYLYINNLHNIKVYYCNEPEFDYIIIKNECLFINPFRQTNFYYYFNSSGVNIFLEELNKIEKYNFECMEDKLIDIIKSEDIIILKFSKSNYLLIEDKINKYYHQLYKSKFYKFISLSSNDKKYLISLL